MMDNVTINNNDITQNVNIQQGVIYLSTYDGGNVSISNFNVLNSDLRSKHAIEYWLRSGTGSMTIENVYVNNVTLDTDATVIKTQSQKSFSMKNSTFINVNPRVSSDNSPKLLELSSISLNDQENFLISDTYVEESSVGLIELSQIESSAPLSVDFTISNLTYVDSLIEFPQDLVSFINIETSNDFRIILSDISMSNITFERTGNLLRLGHQTQTILSIINANFYDLSGAQVSIKSSNLQNSDLKTKVIATNINATSSSSTSSSLINIQEGGELMISDSYFSSIDNTESGAVLNAGYQNSVTEVRNTTFKNNVSVYGGVANVQDNSVIKFYDCNFTDNFAIKSGVIQSSSFGYYEMYGSQITQNYAFTISVSEIFIGNEPCVMSDSSIYNNTVMTKQEILDELESCDKLCFISDSFKQYVNQNVNLLESVQLQHSIQLISSSLNIMNNTVVTTQPSFISSYLSELSISNSMMHQILTDDSIISATESNLILDSVTAHELTTLRRGVFVYLSSGSKASFTNTTYEDSSVELTKVLSSSLEVSYMKASNLELQDDLMNFVDSDSISIQNAMIENVNSGNNYLMFISSSIVHSISNLTVKNINTTVFYMLKSNVTDATLLDFDGVSHSIHFEE